MINVTFHGKTYTKQLSVKRPKAFDVFDHRLETALKWFRKAFEALEKPFEFSSMPFEAFIKKKAFKTFFPVRKLDALKALGKSFRYSFGPQSLILYKSRLNKTFNQQF